MENLKPILIIGGGPAGMEAAFNLSNLGYKVCLFEKEESLGGKIKNWYHLFPDFTPSQEVCEDLISHTKHENISLYTNVTICKIESKNDYWQAISADKRIFEGSSVLIATGYRIFDATRKEELGYGIYPGVITSADLEKMFIQQKVVNAMGETPRSITFLQCVGSRDEKSGNHYCSRVCCITAVKQSIEVKKMLPNTDVSVFYMDLRMSGQFYEELYRHSQEEYGVRYVRGRISEAAGTFDGRIQIKAEDTLAGLPLKMTTDLLVLMVGIEASESTTELCTQNNIVGDYGFAVSKNRHLHDNLTIHEGLFLAGVCKRPMAIADTIADARSASIEIANYLQTLNK
ncbi:MAG: FAD-dependent oxidoreductase [Bacteroidales bacterium]